MTIEERDTARAIQGIHKELKRFNSQSENIKSIDWEERRYEVAKNLYPFTLDGCRGNIRGAAKEAVDFADILIEELKKGGQG